MARVTTYLNFPNKTEEAFNFYKSVFGTEFEGDIMRFGDAPAPEGAPPMPDDAKKLIMYIALPTLGGHLLMGADAPEFMGFKVDFGTNIYINLEPDTKKDTKKLFDALAVGGTVTMELADMFWGAYFGTCIDKYGVQWMFNCSEK